MELLFKHQLVNYLSEQTFTQLLCVSLCAAETQYDFPAVMIQGLVCFGFSGMGKALQVIAISYPQYFHSSLSDIHVVMIFTNTTIISDMNSLHFFLKQLFKKKAIYG